MNSKKSSRPSSLASPTKYERPKVIAIVGSTGTGKTGLAVRLVKKFGGVIISADSRQIYKKMNIGTAKPTSTEQQAAKHYMIDIVRPDQRYSAGQFQKDVYALVPKLFRAHPEQPIFVVGGSYLYVDAVLKGLDFANTPNNPRERKRLEAMTLAQLQHELRRNDPVTARAIDMKNPRRLIRALEVVTKTGESFYSRRHSSPPAWDVLWLGMQVPQTQLDKHNRTRIDRMFRAGWPREVKRLSKRYRPSSPGFYAHGYREVLEYVKGKTSLEETKQQIAINTRHHAKRQLAWFKKNPDIIWIRPTNLARAASLTKRFLRQNSQNIATAVDS